MNKQQQLCKMGGNTNCHISERPHFTAMTNTFTIINTTCRPHPKIPILLCLQKYQQSIISQKYCKNDPAMKTKAQIFVA